FVKPARMAADLLFVRSIEVAAAREEEIGQAVAVVVNYRHAAAKRLEEGAVARFLAVAIGEVDARLRGHVEEDATSGSVVRLSSLFDLRCLLVGQRIADAEPRTEHIAGAGSQRAQCYYN